MTSPYHRLQWSDGFTLKTHDAPYHPSSGNVMLQFAPTSSQSKTAHLGVGSLQASSCFRFDFRSARVGCDSNSSDCVFNITGLRWDEAAQIEIPTKSEFFTVPACHDADGCELGSILEANSKSTLWWADDIDFSWTDISCSAAVCRSIVRDTTDLRRRRALSGKIGANFGHR